MSRTERWHCCYFVFFGMGLDRMIRFSQQASDQWIKVNLCATPPVIQLPPFVMGLTLSLLASTTDTLTFHHKKWDLTHFWSLFTFEKQTFYITREGLMRQAELHPDRGNSLTPCTAYEAFFLPLCCYFSQPTTKVRTPKARVVRALCLLSMCVIASLKSWGPGRELEYLSADSFKELRARDGSHVRDCSVRRKVAIHR